MCLFFFFFLQSVHTRVYSNHREAIYISLFPCKSRPRVPGITTRDRSTLKYKDVNTGQASRNVSTREEGARRGAKISPASPCDERDSRERKKREFSKLILSMDEWIYVDRLSHAFFNIRMETSNKDPCIYIRFFEIKLYRFQISRC